MEPTVRRAAAGDERRLREITIASKGHWGYDPERVRAWVDGLDLPSRIASSRELHVAEADGDVVSWAELLPPADGVCVLDHLWVDPPWIGRGIGTRLLEVAAERARGLGATLLKIESEPNAVGFYTVLGARHVRDETSSWGRPLPVLELAL
jgi:GNAT superfamily N-acetyltransferase